MNEESLLASVIFVFGEPLLVTVGCWDEDISFVGFLASTWGVKSVLVTGVS